MTWFGLKVFTRGAEVGTPRHTEFPPHAPPHGPCHVHNHTYTHTTTQRHTHHTRQIVAALKQYTLREGGTHWNRGAWQDCRAGPFPACLQPRHSRHTCTTPAAHSNRVAMAKLGQNYDYQARQPQSTAHRSGAGRRKKGRYSEERTPIQHMATPQKLTTLTRTNYFSQNMCHKAATNTPYALLSRNTALVESIWTTTSRYHASTQLQAHVARSVTHIAQRLHDTENTQTHSVTTQRPTPRHARVIATEQAPQGTPGRTRRCR